MDFSQGTVKVLQFYFDLIQHQYEMTTYNTVKFNVKLFNLQLSRLKSRIKNRTKVILKLSLNVVGYSNDETNFRYKFLLTDTQVSRILKTFANGASGYIKFYYNLL